MLENEAPFNVSSVTLSERQAKILCYVERRAGESLAKLAKGVEVRPHTLDYELSALKERGIIGEKKAFTNFYALGYTDYTFFFNVPPAQLKNRERIIEALRKVSSVKWLAEFSGEYQYALALFARTPLEARDVLSAVTTRHGNFLESRAASIRLRFKAYGRRYLAPKFSGPSMEFSPKTLDYKADDRDLEILECLVANGAVPQRDLARSLSMSPSALNERVKKLEKKEVIQGYFFPVDPSRLGVIQYRLLLYLKGVEKALLKKIETYCDKKMEVLYYVECLGEWDCEVGIEVHSASRSKAIVQELYDMGGDIITRIRMLHIVQHIKSS